MADKKDKYEWCIISRSVTGIAHVKAELPNQDAIASFPESKRSEKVVLALSDGHGGKRYFRSQVGADFAVKAAKSEMQRFLEDALPTFPNLSITRATLKEYFPRIVRRWTKEVKDHFDKTPFTDDERKMLSRRDRQIIETDPIIAYGATLLIVLATETFIAYFQLGDGEIFTVSESGDLSSPLPEDKRLIADETTSLCLKEAWYDFRFIFQQILHEWPALILLSTDGYVNAFTKKEGFFKVGTELLKIIRTEGLEYVEAHLNEWLTIATEYSGDDSTLGILCRADILESSQLPVNTKEDMESERVKKRSEVEALQPHSNLEVQEVSSVVQKLIVSKQGDGHFTSIRDAIRIAPPKSFILVQPGLYIEELVINKEVKIIGDGAVNQIIIKSKNIVCLQVQTDTVEIQNLTLCSRVDSVDEACYAIDIQRGRLVLTNCDIVSNSLGCVTAGHNTELVIQQSRIQGGMTACINLYAGQAIVEDCDISGNNGILVAQKSNAVIRRCKLHDTKHSGVFLYGEGQAIVEDCDISGNRFAGIEALYESRADIRESHMYNNRFCAIYARQNGSVTLKNCDLRDNGSKPLRTDRGGEVKEVRTR